MHEDTGAGQFTNSKEECMRTVEEEGTVEEACMRTEGKECNRTLGRNA